MHRLKVPASIAGARVDRDHRVHVRILGRATSAAVENIGLLSGEHGIDQSAIHIDRQRRCRMKQRRGADEPPAFFAAAHVIGTHAARRTVRADDDEVLEQRRRTRIRARHRDFPAGTERGCLLSRGCIERDERASYREEDACRNGCRRIARPIREAALRRHALRQREAPNLGTRVGAQRDDAIRRRRV
jgi:hypothetical protein